MPEMPRERERERVMAVGPDLRATVSIAFWCCVEPDRASMESVLVG